MGTLRGTFCTRGFASDATIGKEVGIANREVVAKYRRLAIELGWLTPNGRFPD
jgi:hypothetical protein